MKVVFCALNGSWGHTNLAIRCLRPPLEREGFEVVLKEHTLRERSAHILEDLVSEKADIYGFSCYIWNINQMLELSNSLRQILKECKIVFGGPEVSFSTERFEGAKWIDAIICGEGEKAMVQLCKQIRDGEVFPRIIRQEPSRVMENEGILYLNGESTGGILYYESSRGCPFGCAYCLSCTDRKVRYKSALQTLSDIEAFEKLDVNCKIIKFVDRTFNADIERANAIWKALLSEKFTKHYHFEICASLLNEESFEIFSKFPKGKIQLEIGLQSTNMKTLEASARHISPSEVISSAKRIYDMGNIHVHLDLIAGLPYESYESFSKSFDDAYGSSHMLQLGFLKLLHGTPLREAAEEYGYSFLSNPPYTVLQNKWITFEEMQRLSHIAEVLERYFESGRFIHSLWYLTPFFNSPFKFWEGLSDFLKKRGKKALQSISQPDAYRYLLEYALEALPVKEKELKEALCADFSEAEHKNPPAFLR